MTYQGKITVNMRQSVLFSFPLLRAIIRLYVRCLGLLFLFFLYLVWCTYFFCRSKATNTVSVVYQGKNIVHKTDRQTDVS